MTEIWVDYGGQDTTGYEEIGTDSLRFPLAGETPIADQVAELQRRCGKWARIKLFKYQEEEAPTEPEEAACECG